MNETLQVHAKDILEKDKKISVLSLTVYYYTLWMKQLRFGERPQVRLFARGEIKGL